MRRRFTTDELALLREAAHQQFRDGRTTTEVADALRVSRTQVGRWRKELGLPRSQVGPLREQLCEDLLRLGKRDSVIARALQINPMTVAGWRKRLGLPPVGGSRRAESEVLAPPPD